MTFRQIGQIALDGVDGDLLARMKAAVEGSAREALTLRPATEIATADAGVEGARQPSIARQGEKFPSAMENGKNARAETPASSDREEQITRAKGETPANLRVVSGRDGRAHAKRVAPLGARPSLVLIWNVDHSRTSSPL